MLFIITWCLSVFLVFHPTWYGIKGILFYPFIFIVTSFSPHFINVKENKRIPFFLFVLFTLYLSWALISLLPSGRSKIEGLLEWSRLFLWMSLAIFFARLTFKQLLKIALVSSYVAALICLANWIALPFFVNHHILGLMPPIGQVTLFADYAALHLPFVLYFIFNQIKEKKLFLALLNGLVFLLIMMGLWLSGTRAAILAFTLSLILVLTFLVMRKKINILQAIGTLVSMLMIFIFFQKIQANNYRGDSTLNRIQQSSQILNGKITEVSSLRNIIYAQSWKMIQAHPYVGSGLGNTLFALPYYGIKTATGPEMVDHPHQEFLYVWAEMGLVAFILFLILWIWIYKKSFQQIFKYESQRLLLSLLCFMGLSMSFISWQFSTNSLFVSSRLLSAIYFALFLKLISNNQASQLKKSQQIFSYLHPLLTLICSLFLCASLIAAYYNNQYALVNSSFEKHAYSQKANFFFKYSYSSQINTYYDLLDQQKHLEALELSKIMESKYPHYPEVLFARGLAEHLNNNNKLALIYFQEAKRLDETHLLAKLFYEKLVTTQASVQK